MLGDIIVDFGLEWNTYNIITIIIKISIITIISLVLGLDRETKQKAVGIKTLVVIGVTSCLLTMISIESFNRIAYISSGGNLPDPLRLPAQIVSGIGFLGGGVIFVKRNQMVTGLTTAAVIWGVASLGIAVGAGFLWPVIISMVAILVTLEFLPILLRKLGVEKKKVVFISLKINDDKNLTTVLKEAKLKRMKVRDVSIKKDVEFYRMDITLIVNSPEYVTEIFKFFNDQSNIQVVEIRQ